MTSGENRPPGRRAAAAVITSTASSAAASSRRAQLEEWKRQRAASVDKPGGSIGAASCDSMSSSKAVGGAAVQATISSRPPLPPATGREALPLTSRVAEPQARAWSPAKSQARKEAVPKAASRMQPGRAATATSLVTQPRKRSNSSRTGEQQQQQQEQQPQQQEQQQSSTPLFSPRKGPAPADGPPLPQRPLAVPPLRLGAASKGTVPGPGPSFPAAPFVPGTSLSSARGPLPSAVSSARPSATHGSELDARRGRQQLEWAHYLVQRHVACLLESMLLGERAEASRGGPGRDGPNCRHIW